MADHFISTAEHGWWAVWPDADMFNEAQAVRQQRDATDVTGMGNFIANASKRWIGTLGEMALARWLDRMGWSYEHFGGCDDLPDFSVAPGLGVSVKTQWLRPKFQPEYDVSVAAQQINDDADDFVFCAWEEVGARLVILGGCNVNWFRENARLYRKGEELPNRSRSIATNPVYRLPAGRLDPPLAWLHGEGVARPALLAED